MQEEWHVADGKIKLVYDDERNPARYHKASRDVVPTIMLYQFPPATVSQTLARKATEQVHGLEATATKNMIQLSCAGSVQNLEDVYLVVESFVEGLNYALRRQATVSSARAARSQSRSNTYLNKPSQRR